jgi:ABC-type multidrug transport system permease subunit
MWKRFLAIFKARSIEFARDKSALSWSLMFPLFLVAGFGFMFTGDTQPLFKVGLINQQQQTSSFLDTKYLNFVDYTDQDKALLKLQQHSLDLLVDISRKAYWVNAESANGYVVEKLLLQSEPAFIRKVINGRQIRYVDWVVPGILGMNMMFGCLFGVGFVIVRYRKNSVLKRLQATPLRASEFLFAQVVSRLLIVLTVTSMVYAGCNLFLDFYMLGSYLNLLVIAALGAMAIISLALVIASRSESEELTGGMLNLITWPMMILSGVWFSLEGTPPFVQSIAQFLPLTHMLEGARAIMSNGDSLWDIRYNVFSLIAMIGLFTGIAAYLFRWDSEAR